MQPITGIQAIAFDTDGTLVDFEKVMRHSLACAIEELERRRPEVSRRYTIDSLIELRNRIAAEPAFRKVTHAGIRLEMFRRIITVTGQPDESLAAGLCNLYLKHRYEDIEVYKDVIPVLTELKKRFRLGIHSNGNSYPEKCGLDGFFDFTVFSDIEFVEKPSPDFYRLVLDRAGCAAGQLLNVGDSLHNDITGAERSGIAAIWLNRSGREAPAGVTVDHQITTLLELPGLLD